jgi:hypothetical protein
MACLVVCLCRSHLNPPARHGDIAGEQIAVQALCFAFQDYVRKYGDIPTRSQYLGSVADLREYWTIRYDECVKDEALAGKRVTRRVSFDEVAQCGSYAGMTRAACQQAGLRVIYLFTVPVQVHREWTCYYGVTPDLKLETWSVFPSVAGLQVLPPDAVRLRADGWGVQKYEQESGLWREPYRNER